MSTNLDLSLPEFIECECLNEEEVTLAESHSDSQCSCPLQPELANENNPGGVTARMKSFQGRTNQRPVPSGNKNVDEDGAKPTEPLSPRQIREMRNLLEQEVAYERKTGLVAVYPYPGDRTSEVRIYRDRRGHLRKKVRHQPPKNMTIMQRLGFQSCRDDKARSFKKDATSNRDHTEPSIEA
jgi:hypothetical protein